MSQSQDTQTIHDQFGIREVDITQDAPKLAVMFNESDDQWPGTITGGIPFTAQSMTEWYEREKMINVYVCETENRIVGYCSFTQDNEEESTGYVDVLNVHPAYQRRSLARRMLTRCVQRCVELGFRQLTLGTWSGNLKSVPLYKKTGFFWVPDTGVHMRNFVPGILTLACTQPFFSHHDWYHTFQRELKQVEDDERWEGMKVFTYHWQEDGDSLTVRVDREARRIVAVETDTFSAAAIAANIEPPKGLSTTITWRLTNRQAQPMPVSLIATGSTLLQTDHRETLVVDPGATVELGALVQVAADAPDVQHSKPVPVIRTLLVMGGEILELNTGLQPRPAVEVDSAPKHVTLFPGRKQQVHLQLRSYLSQDVEAKVCLAPSPGLTTDWTERTVAIPAKSFAGLPVTLNAEAPGVYAAEVTVYFEGGETPPHRIAFFALFSGGVLADKAEHSTRLENEWGRLVVHHRGGGLDLFSSRGDAAIVSYTEQLGPPFWPSELEDKVFDVSIREHDGQTTVEMSASLDTYPGLTLQRHIHLGAGPLVRIDHVLANRGITPHLLQLAHRIWGPRERATITLPLQHAIVQARMSEFPTSEEDVDKKVTSFAERWMSITADHKTLGVIWSDDIEENEFQWAFQLLTHQFECPPQEWTSTHSLLVYLGPGDWRAVRDLAQRAAGAAPETGAVPVEHRRVHSTRLVKTACDQPEGGSTVPLVTVEDKLTTKLVVDNLRGRSLKGSARIQFPEGMQSNRDEFSLHDVALGRPQTEEVTIHLPPAPTAYAGSCTLSTRLFDETTEIPIIRLGNLQQVAVTSEQSSGQTVFSIDNQRFLFTVAPDFSGALTGWREGKTGVNHLLSPFPEPATLGWISPWYGGVTPVAMMDTREDFPGKLDREDFTSVPTDAADKNGIPWRGVSLGSALTREQWVGLRVELDYLTVGHSNVLKLVYRVRNTTSAKRRLVVGWISYWQPDADVENTVLRSEDVQRKRSPWQSEPEGYQWGSVTNQDTGCTAILTSPYPTVRLMDWGSAGGHLGCLAPVDVAPYGVLERVCYVALCRSVASAQGYRWLKQYVA